MDSLSEGEKINHAIYSIKEGLTLFLRNLQLVIPVLTIILISYFLIIFAVFTVIPTEKIQEITEKYQNIDVSTSEKVGEEVIKELSTYLSKDLVRTISIFLLFGLLVFVLHEFNNAGIAASSIEVARSKTVSISYFLEKGFLYTVKMVQIDLIAILIGVAISSPIFLFFYFGIQSFIVEIVLSIVLVFVMLLTTFSRFYVIDKNTGIFESIAKGTEFLFKNISGVFSIFFIWFIITLPFASLSFVFPPLIFLWPALIVLFYIFMAGFYVSLNKKIEEENSE
ncbi:hypothetical protein DRP07_04660 [Archaeoglobales archaeon]|nr:MAG: hypothetical protein DRP07_04660 [Archaeoglobales archaeon]